MWPGKCKVLLQSSYDLCDRERAKFWVVPCVISLDNQQGEASKKGIALELLYCRIMILASHLYG